MSTSPADTPEKRVLVRQRRLLVPLAAFAILVLAACNPAALNPVNCFVEETFDGFAYVSVPSGPGEVLLRHDDGSEVTTANRNGRAFVSGSPTEFTVVARNADGTGETVAGPRCSVPTRQNPTEPEPTLQWLPGAFSAGEGVRGPVRLSWAAVTHEGDEPRFYEVQRTVDVRDGSPFERGNVETLMFGSDARMVDTVLEVDEHLEVRAWWDDGVSAPVEVEPPLQIGNGDIPRRIEVTDVAWLTPVPNNPSSGPQQGWVRVEWATAYDSRGVPADRYQRVEEVSHDGLRPLSYNVVQELDGSTTSAMLLSRLSPSRRTLGLRAVWDNGGPLGGPQIALGKPGGPNPISGLALNNVAGTTAQVSFDTSTCTYGDYRIALKGQSLFALDIDEFDAPRDGSCYFNHGITIGVDTPPLTANSSYQLTVVATDAETGAVHSRTLSFTTGS